MSRDSKSSDLAVPVTCYKKEITDGFPIILQLFTISWNVIYAHHFEIMVINRLAIRWRVIEACLFRDAQNVAGQL